MRIQDIDHAHPHTKESFGEVFRRGPAIAADGGTAESEEETDEQTMDNLTHQSPTEGPARSLQRDPARHEENP